MQAEDILERLNDCARVEKEARKAGFIPLAGVDEAGRSPLAGPVVACACILPSNFPFSQVKDSKLLSEKERERLFKKLTSFPGVEYAIEMASEKEIDLINILQATLSCMKKAVEALKIQPRLVLVDGNCLPTLSYPAKAVIQGDVSCPSISAASILAKVTRDAIVREYDKKWPEWRFSEHKGYGTQYHFEMIRKYGALEVHRRSFEPIKSLLNMEFQGTIEP